MADVVVAGAAGRMGSRLVALLQQETELRLVAALEAPGHPALGRDAGESAGVGRIGIPIAEDVEAALGQDRILIEFSVPEASLAHARLVERHGGRAVIGTTGFSAAQREELARIGRGAPLLVSPNMSVAVNVAFKVLADMARMLGDDYDVEIVETHHRFKKDAPSGTALRMAEVVAQALGRDLATTAVYDRHDRLAERTPEGDRHGRPALRRRGGRAHRVLRLAGRAARAHPSRPQPGQLRARRAARSPLHRDRATRPLLHAGRPGPGMRGLA